jgi:tripartite-type tricarboxylate transporter receptor subunit TctC
MKMQNKGLTLNLFEVNIVDVVKLRHIKYVCVCFHLSTTFLETPRHEHHQETRMSLNRRALLLSAGAFAIRSQATEAVAQSGFPSKPFKLVVPFAPGGAGDILARMINPNMGTVMGQPVVVDNRAGAGGAIGAQVAARSDPDGYTALIHSSTLVINPQLSKAAGYDFRVDFVPVATVADFPLVLVVHPSVPARTVPEFLAYARTKGTELFYGSAGSGSTQNLVGELFNSMAGTSMKHVPYRGNAPATASLLAGDIQVMFDIVPNALSYGQSGKIRSLAVTGTSRNSALPELPTLLESGVRGFDFSIWYAFFLPKGSSAAAVQHWRRGVEAAQADKEVLSRLAAQGFQPLRLSSTDLAALMERDAARWGKLIADSHIKTD